MPTELKKKIASEQIDSELRKRLKIVETKVRTHVRVQLTRHKYDALVSFTYNVGPGLGADPVIHLINNGQNTAAAMMMKQHGADQISERSN